MLTEGAFAICFPTQNREQQAMLSFYSYCIVTWITVYNVQLNILMSQEFVLKQFGGNTLLGYRAPSYTMKPTPSDLCAN